MRPDALCAGPWGKDEGEVSWVLPFSGIFVCTHGTIGEFKGAVPIGCNILLRARAAYINRICR